MGTTSARHRGSRRHLVPFAAVAVALIGLAGPSRAQSLNDEVERLLGDNCIALGRGTLPQDPAEFGANLLAICEVPTTSNPSSSGGGAASSQGSSLSIESAAIRKRLKRARDRKDAQEGGTSSSWGKASAYNAQLLAPGAAAGAETSLGSQRFDFFASASYESLDRNLTDFEDAYDSKVTGATLGADYQFTDSFVMGVVATARKQEGDFGGGGRFEKKSFEPALYASFLPSESTFLQIVAGMGSQDFDATRNAQFTVDRPDGDPDQITELGGLIANATESDVLSAGATFGWDRSVKSFTFGPRVGVSWASTEVDGYVESGTTGLELRVLDSEVDSLQGIVGFFGSTAISGSHGVFVPQFTVEYVHEFEDSPATLSAQFVEDLREANALTFNYLTNTPDADFFNLDIGFAQVFPGGTQLFVNIRTVLGNSLFDSYSGTLGMRFEF